MTHLTMILVSAAVTSLLAAFGILLMRKLGFLTWLEIHLNPGGWISAFVRRVIQCEFCLAWWCNFALSIIVVIFTGYWPALVAAVLATPLTWKITW